MPAMRRPPGSQIPRRGAPQADHRARKRFGQHFLADESIIDAIIREIEPSSDDIMVEIGPGLGALTFPLLERLARLHVIELDRDLAARLRRHDGLDVIEADVLDVDFVALSRQLGRALRIVGNLPYNISTPILFRLLDQIPAVADQHFMLQKEVVDRMVARPGHKAYGRLSVMLQWRYDMESVLEVPPQCFEPPPRVDSAVVRMVPRSQPVEVDAQRLSRVVTTAFSQRRKLLRHTLGPWIEAQALTTDFDLQRRAEEVSVEEYLDLARLAIPS